MHFPFKKVFNTYLQEQYPTSFAVRVFDITNNGALETLMDKIYQVLVKLACSKYPTIMDCISFFEFHSSSCSYKLCCKFHDEIPKLQLYKIARRKRLLLGIQ